MQALQLIEEAYTILAELGFTHTQYAFSRRYLGQSSSYFSYLRATFDAKPSIQAIAHLAAMLGEMSMALTRFRPLTEEQQQHREQLFRLSRKLSGFVFREAIARARPRQPDPAPDDNG